MSLFRIFDNTRIRQCVYQTMKQSVELHGTPLGRKYHLMDWFVFTYAILRLLQVAYVIGNKFEISPEIPYKIERDDPFMHYLKQNSEMHNVSVPITFLFMTYFNFLCQFHFYKLDVSKNVWQWWYQLLVTNQDDYYRFKLNNYQLIKMAKTNRIGNRFRRYRISMFVPDFIINICAFIYSGWLIKTNLEDIDREKFLSKKLSLHPNLSDRLKIRMARILIVSDQIWFGFQLFFSRLQATSKINCSIIILS